MIVEHRYIAIEDMPVGDARRNLEEIAADPRAYVWAVLIKSDDSWLVKVGRPDWWNVKFKYRLACQETHSPEQVADLGDEVSYAEAVALFPQMREGGAWKS